MLAVASSVATAPCVTGFTTLVADEDAISAVFSADTPAGIVDRLADATGAWVAATRAALAAASPLSLHCAQDIIRSVRAAPDIATALDHEYRFTARSLQHGDFLEGIRAQIIERDRTPHWRHADLTAVPAADIARMHAPLQQEPTS